METKQKLVEIASLGMLADLKKTGKNDQYLGLYLAGLMEGLWGQLTGAAMRVQLRSRTTKPRETREGSARGPVEEAAVPVQAAFSCGVREGIRTDCEVSDPKRSSWVPSSHLLCSHLLYQ